MLKEYAVVRGHTSRRRLIRRALGASLWLALSASSSFAAHSFAPIPPPKPAAPDTKRELSLASTPGGVFIELLGKHLETKGDANEIVLDSFHPKFNDEDVPPVKPQQQVSRAHAESLLKAVRFLRAYVQGLRKSCLATAALRAQHETTLAFTAYVDEFLQTLDTQVTVNAKNPNRLRTKLERERLAKMLGGVTKYFTEKSQAAKFIDPIDDRVGKAVYSIQASFLWFTDQVPDTDSREGKLLKAALDSLDVKMPLFCKISDKLDSTPPQFDLSTLEIRPATGAPVSAAVTNDHGLPEVKEGEKFSLCLKVTDAQSGIAVAGNLTLSSEKVDGFERRIVLKATSYDRVTQKLCFATSLPKGARAGEWRVAGLTDVSDDYQEEGDTSPGWSHNVISETFRYEDRPAIGFVVNSETPDEEGPKPKWETLRVTRKSKGKKDEVLTGKDAENAIVHQVNDGDELLIHLEMEDALSGVDVDANSGISLSWGEHSLATGFSDAKWLKDGKTIEMKFTVPKHTPHPSYRIGFTVQDRTGNATMTFLEKSIELAVTTKVPDTAPPKIETEKAALFPGFGKDPIKENKITVDDEEDGVVVRVPIKDELSSVSYSGELNLEGPNGFQLKLTPWMFSSGDGHIDFRFDSKKPELPAGDYKVISIGEVSDTYDNKTSEPFKNGPIITLKKVPKVPVVPKDVVIPKDKDGHPTYEKFPKPLQKLVLELNHDDFRTREAASLELWRHGPSAIRILKEAIATDGRPELSRRAQSVLARVQRATFEDSAEWSVVPPKR